MHPRETFPPAPRRSPAAALAAASCALGVLALCACGPGPPAGRAGQGVLLIAVDGLRADHLGVLGYDRDTTASMDALAADGAVFSSAFASAPLAIPAHAALLTGCDAFVAQRTKSEDRPDAQRWNVSKRGPRLAVEFLAAGYRTALVTDSEFLVDIEGFTAGFQDVIPFEPLDQWLRRDTGLAENGRRVAQWVSNLGEGESWFAYVHTQDLERAWRFSDTELDSWFAPRPELDVVPPVSQTEPALFAIPRPRWLGGRRPLGDYEARYDGALLWLDRQLRVLLERLEHRGRLEDTVVCVVGTRGQQFGEAGMWLDAGLLSVPDLSVPIVLSPSRGRRFEPGQLVESIASTVDVAPTLLDLVGLPVPAGMHGRSQMPALDGAAEPPRRFAFASCGLLPGYTVFGERLALEVVQPGSAARGIARSWFGESEESLEFVERLYDHRADPCPPFDQRLEVGGPTAHEIRGAGSQWVVYIDQTRRALQAGGLFGGQPITAEERAKLERLGYLARGGE